MISVSIDTSNFRRRYQRYCQAVREKLESSWEEILLVCIKDILSRTPSEAEELAYILGEQGGEFIGGKPVKDNPLRISFIREPGQWLQQLIQDPSTYQINASELTMKIGLVPALEAGSGFSWQNVSKGETIIHSTAELGYSMWSFFEYGRVAMQKAAFVTNKPYRLMPGDQYGYWSSTKNYPAFRFYSGFNYSIFKDAVITTARSVQF